MSIGMFSNYLLASLILSTLHYSLDYTCTSWFVLVVEYSACTLLVATFLKSHEMQSGHD